MANTRTTLINSLVTGLGGLTGINKATNRLYSPSQAREWAPYIGVLVASEEIHVEDSTHIRYALQADLIMLAPDADIDVIVDRVKTYIYGNPSIGAKQIKIIGHEELSNVSEDQYSSVRLVLEIIYVATKGAF